MKIRGRFPALVAFLLCAAMILSLSASAAYYNTYTTVKSPIPDSGGCYAMQGFAVGSTYTYSVKRNADETSACIYRTKMSDGSNSLMTNSETGTAYCTYLGHANDMDVTDINGVNHLFVVTMKTGSLSLVKISYSGTTYTKVGNFTIKLAGVDKSMSGVKILSQNASTINFLFKSGATFYKGSIGLTANSGTINVTSAFSIDPANSLINGSKISNIADFVYQGFGLYDDKAYVPMTDENVSLVFVFDNVSTASGTIIGMSNLSFRITSSTYPDQFEIESCSVGPDGHLWFDVNRRTDPSDNAHDAVCYFDGYIA